MKRLLAVIFLPSIFLPRVCQIQEAVLKSRASQTRARSSQNLRFTERQEKRALSILPEISR